MQKAYLARSVLTVPFFIFLILLTAAISSAQGKKLTLGYSTVGPAGTGLWMAKETGAFEEYGIVAAAYHQKERALKVIQKYTRLKDPKLIEELYTDAVKFLDREPRVDAEAIAPIVEFMGKKPIAVESLADNSVIDRLVREGFVQLLTPSADAELC